MTEWQARRDGDGLMTRDEMEERKYRHGNYQPTNQKRRAGIVVIKRRAGWLDDDATTLCFIKAIYYIVNGRLLLLPFLE